MRKRFFDVANVLRVSFVRYCRTLDKPLVMLFDEAEGKKAVVAGC